MLVDQSEKDGRRIDMPDPSMGHFAEIGNKLGLFSKLG